MTATKGAIIRTIEQMDETNASMVLDWLKQQFSKPLLVDEWDLIPEEEPDEWDLEMLNEIENNPDCQVYVTEQEKEETYACEKESTDI
jgi:hypothetical protein